MPTSRCLSPLLLFALATGGGVAASLSAAEPARPAENSFAETSFTGQLRRGAAFAKAQGLTGVAAWLEAQGNDLDAVVSRQIQSIAEESRRLQAQADALSRLTGAPTRVEVEVRTVEFDLLKLDTPEGAAFLKEQKIPVPAHAELLGEEVTRVAVASRFFLFAAAQKGFARQVGCPSVVTRLGEESTVHMDALPSPAAVEQNMRVGLMLSARLVRAEKDRVAVEVKHSISSENGSTVPLAGGGVSPVLDVSSARSTLTMVPGTPLILGGMGKWSTSRFRPPGSDPDDPAAEQVFESKTMTIMILNVTRAE